MFYTPAVGVRIARLGEAWAAFSSLSGETMLLNTEAAAIIELLASGPADEDQVAATLAMDTGADATQVIEALRHTWGTLISAGLVELAEAPEHNPG